jgi:hypothetical protein
LKWVLLLVLAASASSACRRVDPACAGGHVVLVAPESPVGFDAAFSVEVRPLCARASEGTIAWRQVEGASARALVPDARGMGLSARTPTLAEALGGPPAWGLVPLSPRTQGALLFEATWSDGQGASERHTARVVAAARARGLPNVPLGAAQYLGGAGWRLEARPGGSTAALVSASGATSLTPDVAGDYRLVDGAGRALALRAGRYDSTPLDCGRSGCHVDLARAADASPMTSVLARGIVPAAAASPPVARFGAGYPRCALACHATGEPGVADGGFAHVHHELATDALGPRAWETVPAPLRRLGGVGCLACHGPGALPEATSRWSVLRADVCATCHDAPPRYGHVGAWRASAMARADRDPRAAREPACARCHTTWGFLAASRGADASAPVDRRPPAEVGGVGITCAACHAVHDPASTGRTPRLLRATPVPAVLAGAPLHDRSRVCLGCHAPEPGEGAPSASAAALWAGRGGLDPATGRALEAPAVHGAVAGGCVGCHRSGPEGLERGGNHSFVARRADCASCHAKGLPQDDLAARARALWATLPATARGEGEGAGPPHARTAVRFDRGTPLGRAAWNISLVLEDRAAAAHNAPYARQLLAAAERALNGRAP